TATAPTATYTLSLHDALPILGAGIAHGVREELAADGHLMAAGGRALDQRHDVAVGNRGFDEDGADPAIHQHGHQGLDPGKPRLGDRKSTRLNSSHVKISYAVF